MTMRKSLRITATLLLTASLAACVQPPAAPPQTQAAAAPTRPAPPPERLNLALKSDSQDWISAGDSALDGGGDMQEYVPAGQTVADWSQMITVLTLPPSQDPTARLTALLKGLRAACKTYNVVQSTARDDATRSANLLARCDKPDDTALNNDNILLAKHEAIWAKTLEGRADNYLVLRAWHADAITPDSVLRSAGVRRQWQDWADRVAVVPNGGA